MNGAKRRDAIRMLKKLTVRKIWNIIKVRSSYILSRWTSRPLQWGLPVSIAVEPTTSCNLRCPECPSGLRAFTRPTGMLQPDFFSRTIDQIYKDSFYLILYFQGEPYLNPDFLQMASYASQKGMYTATSTNGHYLTEENCKKTVESGLDRLIISIDGITQEVYQQYRVGGNLDKVLEGAKRMAQWKKKMNSATPHIIFQFLVVKPNEHQIEEVKQLGKQIGVDEVRFKTAQVYDYEQDPNRLIPTDSRYSRYKKDKNGNWTPKGKMENHCWRLWHAPVITWDGLMVPCCFDKDADHRMGDLKTADLRTIWKSEKYLQFRKAILKGRKNIDICANCSEGVKVWEEV